MITASTLNRISIPTIIPETKCGNCHTTFEERIQDSFDADGYLIARSIVHAGQTARADTSAVSRDEESSFRFLDLSAEVRNTI